jgi:AcrR family transcriptional regulator
MGRRAGATPLTPERIYTAALDIVDSEGLDRLSMRKLGSALGVDPMAIYHHLPNKDALFHGMVAFVFSRLTRPTESGSWKARVRQWARSYRAIVVAHPNLVLEVVTRPDAVAVAASHANDSLHRALEGSGLRPVDVVRSGDVIVDYVNGSVLAAARGELPSDVVDELDASFDFGLGLVIAGIENLARRRGASA